MLGDGDNGSLLGAWCWLAGWMDGWSLRGWAGVAASLSAAARERDEGEPGSCFSMHGLVIHCIALHCKVGSGRAMRAHGAEAALCARARSIGPRVSFRAPR